MAKKALLDVLEQTIGKYVKNLDAESLNVAVWSGKIELHSLELDIHAVNSELDRQAAETPNLAVPFKVVSGSFEGLEVDVPWAHLMSRPVIMRARGLKVFVEPCDRLSQADHLQAVVANEGKRAAKIREARKQSIEQSDKYRLQANAMRKLAEADLEGSSDSANPTSSSFSSRLVRRIIENIQIEVSDVHVRLNDLDGSAGVVLESLSLVTTDKAGTRTFVDRTAASNSVENTFLYKQLQINGFGVYLNQTENSYTKLVPVTEDAVSESDDSQNSYALAPLSFQATLRQADGQACIEYAKYLLSSELSSLSILLSRSQLDLVRKISKKVVADTKGPLFPEYRPLSRVTKETAADWWKYALRCVGRLNGRRSWAEFFLAFKMRKTYIPLYKRYAHHASCAWIKQLTPAEKDELLAIEDDRSISAEGIMSWRNIADAQMEKEREKHISKQPKKEQSSSVFSSIFGSRDTPVKQAEVDEPPIHLSVDELRELEDMSKLDFVDEDISKDAKLYDVNFVLSSLKINLTAYDLRHVAALDMGIVSANFNASADGAYEFQFMLTSLEVKDMSTPNSLFPSVLRSANANNSIQGGALVENEEVFKLHLEKTKIGDQKLFVRLAEFEMVASPVLIREVKRFFSDNSYQLSSNRNPLLAQSLSGSVDLFYDADEGSKPMQSFGITEEKNNDAANPTNDISNRLIDAWNDKKETKAKWVMDVDINAPVVVIPEKCSDPRANVLIFDLGRLKLQYGKINPAQQVEEWLRENPRQTQGDKIRDSGSLEISDLTFMVGKANYWNRLLQKEGPDDDSAVVEPISISLDFGVESVQGEDVTRVCGFGVIPTISLKLSPFQGSRIFAVVNAWGDFLDEIKDTPIQQEVPVEPDIGLSDRIIGSPAVVRLNTKFADNTEGQRPIGATHPIFHLVMGLQRLSVTAVPSKGSSMEAHLVSVYASTSVMSDGSSLSQLRMGWFWVLDQLQGNFKRRQRLVAHSNLPLSPESFALDEKYAILDTLTELGVFDREFAGSTELANVMMTKPSSDDMGSKNDDGEFAESVLDVKFSSLFIHWNPNAVKAFTSMIEKFTSVVEEHAALVVERSTLIMSPGKNYTPKKAHRELQVDKTKEIHGRLIVTAKMERLDINLNSALDDYPLFVLTMSRAQVNIEPSKSADEGMVASLVLGDLRMRTPEMGQTKTSYRTLIGLAPGRSDSLLTIKYCVGASSIETMTFPSIETSKLEACADVELSPMRIVYIHSQIMALVEYISEGILGALAAQAASSAAEAAKEMANSVAGEKFFLVKATAFDLVLPQSAISEKVLSIHAGLLEVGYRMFPDPGGGEARVSLADVSLKGTLGKPMQEKPIRMDINVKLPPDEVGTFEDQAMKVNIETSQATFIVSRSQYAQILRTMKENMGEVELYLRDSGLQSAKDQLVGREDETREVSGNSGNADMTLTHAGVAAVVKLRRLYLNVKVSVLALELCGSDMLDPIIRIAAVNSGIELKQFPDEERMTCDISLGNLVCNDRRAIANSRQYRSLIDQRTSESTNEAEDFFCIEYKSENNSSQIDLRIGSPNIVFIPDAISEVLRFLRVEDDSLQGAFDAGTENNGTGSLGTERQVVHLDSNYSEDVEASIHTTARGEILSTMHVSLKTDRCQFVLVDLGSQWSGLESSVTGKPPPLAETIVIQGMFAATLLMTSDVKTNEMISADLESQADGMEAFTAFGSDMRSPLQILDPAEFSAHGSMKTTDLGEMQVELRAAALTPFEVVFSMHNAALLNAIVNGLQESFSSDLISEETEDHNSSLNANETKRIEELASALETVSSNESMINHQLSNLDDSSTIVSRVDSVKTSSSLRVEVKLTMPETRVTVINDLQGLDEALFRVTVANFVAGGHINNGGSSGETTFDFHLNTSILADYFDSSPNLWNVLLTKPWEITLKGLRAPSARFRSKRLSTTIDLESFPCCVSFSEQFLASLAGAKRMWSIYAAATTNSVVEPSRTSVISTADTSLKRSMAASAARNLVTSLPYAIENHSGLDATFLLPGSREACRKCPNGTIQYFRFEPPRGRGFGGNRLYGQDVLYEKSVTLFFQETMVQIGHLDSEVQLPRSAHKLGDGRVLLTHVAKEGKTIVLHLTSYVEVHNRTGVPFLVSILLGDQKYDVGVCGENRYHGDSKTSRRLSSLTVSDGSVSKASKRFSIPLELMSPFVKEWASEGRSKLSLSVAPLTSGEPPRGDKTGLQGIMYVESDRTELQKAYGGLRTTFDVTCRDAEAGQSAADPFVVQVVVQMVMVGKEHISLSIFLEPRAFIENKMPVSIHLRTPMPHTFSSAPKDDTSGKYVTYNLRPDDRVEVFTPGPSIAVTSKTSDMPVAGQNLGWMDGGWMDLPLVTEFRLPEPLLCMFPFSESRNQDPLVPVGARGTDFFIVEGRESLAGLSSFRESKEKHRGSDRARQGSSSELGGVELLAPSQTDESIKTFFLTVCYYAVDHTGDLLFEQVAESTGRNRASITSTSVPRRRTSTTMASEPLSAFSSSRHRRRISLLPSAKVLLRLLQLTMDGDEGVRKSLPFLVEDIAIGEGGVGSTPLHWEDKEPSGYYAYRKLLNEHQSEVHVIPEFIVFNGSSDVVLVKEKGRPEIIIEPGQIASLRAASRSSGLELSFSFIEFGCRAPFLQVGNLGLKVAIVKSHAGSPIGSVCVQTVIDTQGDSRLVVKVGDVKFGSLAPQTDPKSSGFLQNDCVRFRVRWTQLLLTLNEARSRQSAGQRIEEDSKTGGSSGRKVISNVPSSPGSEKPRRTTAGLSSARKLAILQRPVATIIFERFTVDYQRIFKDEAVAKSKSGGALLSPERSQLSVIIHNLQIKDEDPNSPFPIVFDSFSNISFLDLCIRVRGASDADLVKVDLFELNLAHLNGQCDRIILNTSEEFVWRLLDLSNRIVDASGELAGLTLKLEEDKEHGGYVVSMVDAKTLRQDDEVKYTPPQSDKLYDINLARVSPFKLLLSFRRTPQASRYKNVRGANLMNYFTQRLKFTIDKAELRFARYENRNLKGPPDRLLESLCAVYLSRMKLKLITLLTAASFQDWKFLASRDDGDDEFVEGDILRATGNLAGSTAGLLFKKVGKGLESGVSGLSHTVGNTFEKSAGKVGAGKLGVGVNSVVSGVGDGFGETISGVGVGAGKVLKGAGQGLGHMVGGVTGGVLLMGKGIGKGIVTGDGKAVASGFTQGATSMGSGVGQGVESAVMGAADGVLSAGHGLFAGFKTVGRGIGGAVKGKKPEKRQSKT